MLAEGCHSLVFIYPDGVMVIDWNDGSGDKIYVESSFSGDSALSISSDLNSTNVDRSMRLRVFPVSDPSKASVVTVRQYSLLQDPIDFDQRGSLLLSGDVGGSVVSYICSGFKRYLGKPLGPGVLMVTEVVNVGGRWEYLDGEPANYSYLNEVPTEGEPWICPPNFCFKVIPVTTDVYQVEFRLGSAPDASWVEWDNICIGMAECSMHNSRAYTHYGFVSYYYDELEAGCLARGEGFSLSSYAVRCAITALRICYAGNTTYSSDFLGLTSYFTDWQEWCSGMVINNRVPTITNLDGSVRVGVPLLPDSGYVAKLVLGPYFDIYASEYGANNYTGYQWTSGLVECHPRAKAGMSRDDLVGFGFDRQSNDYKAYGRLQFKGKLEVVDPVTYRAFKPTYNWDF